jgi:FixJ family two-component response regulator
MLRALIGSVGIDVRTYATATEFLEDYRPAICECLVCDVRMPGMGGLQVQSQLLAKGASLPIIFITGYAEVGAAVQAMKAGAFDFVEKPFGNQAFLDKVQKALSRSRELYADRMRRATIEARLALLTNRERNVGRLVVEGKTSREISELMGVSVRTVENHRAHILEKLRVRSALELVRLFP